MSLLSHDTRFCPADAQIWHKNDQFWLYVCPNNECESVQTTAEPFQSHNSFMSNVCEAWHFIRTELCHANPLSSVKMAPKLRHFEAKNEELSDYYGQNTAWAWTHFAAKLFQGLSQLIRNVYGTWEGNSTCFCYPMTPVSVQRTPKFGRKWHISGLFVPK